MVEAKRPRLAWPSWRDGCAESRSGELFVKTRLVDATDAVGVHEEGFSIACGIAFLDHMVDQLTAHAQLKVCLEVSWQGQALKPHSNEAKERGFDEEVAKLVGTTLGAAMKELLSTGSKEWGERLSSASSFRFCAPLDEAFTELHLDFPGPGSPAGASLDLAPYGTFPRSGRTHIGAFRTKLTEVILLELAKALGCGLRVRKVRGDNAHHIVEATFKSLARCFRKALDHFCGFSPGLYSVTLPYQRHSTTQRSTKETSIEVSVDLDPCGKAPGTIKTGLTTLDQILSQIQQHSGAHMAIKCSGDLWIDDHHSTEDVMITVGKALAQCLGSKAGVNRMGCADGTYGSAKVLCVMDLSNRPSICSDLRLDAKGEEMVGDVSVEMIVHCFESLCTNGLMTVHFVQEQTGVEASASEAAMAAAQAFGLALKCMAVDPRRAGATASSKGTLSK